MRAAARAVAILMGVPFGCRSGVPFACRLTDLSLDVKAFAVPRAGWAEAFEQFGIPKGHTGPAEEMFEAVNAGWMELGIEGTEHVAGMTSARDVFAAAQKAATA